MDESLNAFELEMRRVPGVVGLGFEEVDGALVVSVLAAPPGPSPSLLREASDVIRNHTEGQVLLTVRTAGDGAGAAVRSRYAERVRIVAVERVSDLEGVGGSRIDVHLCIRGRQTVGQRPGEGAEPAARAVLAGLNRLDLEVPFTLKSVTAVEVPGANQGFSVVVALGAMSGGHVRLGVAEAPTVEEAASRAVLNALNRALTDDPSRTAAEATVGALTLGRGSYRASTAS